MHVGGNVHHRSNHSRPIHKDSSSGVANDAVVPKSEGSAGTAAASGAGVATATSTSSIVASVGDPPKTTTTTTTTPATQASVSNDVPMSVISTAGGILSVVPPYPSPTLFRNSTKAITTAATATTIPPATTVTTATTAAATATATAPVPATVSTYDAATLAKFPSLNRSYNHVNAGGVHTYNPPYTLSLNYFPHLFDKKNVTAGNTTVSSNTTISG